MAVPVDPASSPPHRYGLVFLVICALGFAAFGQALINAYAYDSVMLINRMRDAPLSAVSVVWSPETYSDVTGVMSYRPLGVLLLLGYDIHLGSRTPAVSHMFNLLIHVANTWLVYFIVHGWLQRFYPAQLPATAAAAASGVLLLHPLVSEVVLCAGFRSDLLALFGLLLGMQFIVRSNGERPIRLLLVLAACQLLSLSAKENGVMGPFVFTALSAALFGLRRLVAPAVFVITGVVTVGFLLVWRQFQFSDYPSTYLGGGGRLLGIANFLVVVREVYLQKLIWPWPLRVDYAFEPVLRLSDSRVLVALGVVCVVALVSLLFARRSQLVALGLFWILLGFAPVSQITPVPDPVAERFCYIPMVGVGLVLAGILVLSARRFSAVIRVAPFVLGFLAVVYLTLDILRSSDWRDDVTLNLANWVQPRDNRPVALEALGAIYLMRAERLGREGRTADSAADYRRAGHHLSQLMKTGERTAERHRLLAVWHRAGGETEYVVYHVNQALRLGSTHAQIHALARELGIETTHTATMEDRQ